MKANLASGRRRGASATAPERASGAEDQHAGADPEQGPVAPAQVKVARPRPAAEAEPRPRIGARCDQPRQRLAGVEESGPLVAPGRRIVDARLGEDARQEDPRDGLGLVTRRRARELQVAGVLDPPPEALES